MRHTPTPWEVSWRTTGSLPWQYYIGHPSESTQVTDEEAEANAKFIERAANSHYELLSICKEMLTIMIDFVLPRVDSESVAHQIVDDATEAVARAEGE